MATVVKNNNGFGFDFDFVLAVHTAGTQGIIAPAIRRGVNNYAAAKSRIVEYKEMEPSIMDLAHLVIVLEDCAERAAFKDKRVLFIAPRNAVLTFRRGMGLLKKGVEKEEFIEALGSQGFKRGEDGTVLPAYREVYEELWELLHMELPFAYRVEKSESIMGSEIVGDISDIKEGDRLLFLHSVNGGLHRSAAETQNGGIVVSKDDNYIRGERTVYTVHNRPFVSRLSDKEKKADELTNRFHASLMQWNKLVNKSYEELPVRTGSSTKLETTDVDLFA